MSEVSYRIGRFRHPTSDIRHWILALLCVQSAWASAYADEPPLNTQCPVMTEEAIDPEITLTYRGKKVAFCCDRCVKKFQAQPEKYLPNLPQFAGLVGGFATTAEEADMTPAGQTLLRPDDSPLTPFWGRLHPAIVHFPVAGLPMALLGLLAWTLSGKEMFARADFVPLVFAALAAVGAVLTGNIAEDSERFSPAMHEVVEWHQLLSTVVMVLALLLVAMRLWRWNRLTGGWRWAYGGGLLAASALVGVTGYLGGSLVFGPDHLKW